MGKMTDNRMIYEALIVWRNALQTGDISLSLQSALDTGQDSKIRMLSSEQQEFVIRLEELAEGTYLWEW
mgnify:CR=1 FL=1